MDLRSKVLDTITALYEVPSLNEADEKLVEARRRKADQFLKDFQMTQEAWSICGSLLVDPLMQEKEQLFACQTIRNKVIYDLAQLQSADLVDALKGDLLYLLFGGELSNRRPSPHGLLGNAMISHRLPNSCHKYLVLALADLACVFDGWTDPVSDIMEAGQKSASTKAMQWTLDFVKELPVELFENRYLHLDSVKANERAQTILDAHAQTVYSFLMQCIESQISLTNEEQSVGILQALSSWAKASVIAIDWFADSPPLQFAFHCLKTSVAVEQSVDLLSLLARKSAVFDVLLDSELYDGEDEEPDSHVNYKANDRSYTIHREHLWQGFGARYCVPLVTSLVKGLNTCIPDFQSAVETEDEEWIIEFAQLLVEFGQRYKYLILETPANFKDIFGVMLQLLQYNSLQVGIHTVPFWDDFSYILVKKLASADPQFLAIYEQLVAIILGQCQYPKLDKPFTGEELEEFREFRHSIGNVLKLCVSVLGVDKSLLLIQNFIVRFTVPAEHLNSVAAISDGWQPLEAALFAVRLMCSKVPLDESVRIPAIMNLILAEGKDGRAIPVDAHPKLRYAATLVIGRYAEWTKLHPSFIPHQLSFISQGFQISECQSACAQALKYLCDWCRKELLPYLGQLKEFYVLIACKLSSEGRLDVTEALSHVLGEVSPDKLLEQLQQFAWPIVQRLDELSRSQEITVTNAIEAHELVEQLSVLFKHVSTAEEAEDDNEEEGAISEAVPAEHPCMRLLSDIFPVLTSLANTFGRIDMVLYDAICRVLRNACRSFSNSLAHQVQVGPVQSSLLYQISQLIVARLGWVNEQLSQRENSQLTVRFRSDKSSLHMVEFAGGPLWLMQVLVDNLLSSESSLQQVSQLTFALVGQVVGLMEPIVSFSASHALFHEAEYMLADYFRMLKRCVIQVPLLVSFLPSKEFSYQLFSGCCHASEASNSTVLEPLFQLLGGSLYLSGTLSYANQNCSFLAGFWDKAEALLIALYKGVFFHYPADYTRSVTQLFSYIIRPQLLQVSDFIAITQKFLAEKVPLEGLSNLERDSLVQELQRVFSKVPPSGNQVVVTANVRRGNLPVVQTSELGKLLGSTCSKMRARLMIVERK